MSDRHREGVTGTSPPFTGGSTAGGCEAGLAAVAAALGRVVPDDAPQQPAVVLADRMRQLERLRAQVDAVLAEQLRAFDAAGGAAIDGQSSTVAWQHARLRQGRDAADLLAVARHLAGLPQVAKAFAAGEVSLEHAAAVARLVAKVGAEALLEYEPVLLELTAAAPPKQLRQVCEHLHQLLDPDTDADERSRQRRRRYLAAGRTIDGMVHLQGLLDGASGDVVLAALKAAMPVPAEYEERTPAQRRADGLVDIAAGWLAAGQAPTAGGIRPQVQVTISLRQLQARLQGWETPAGQATQAAAGQTRNPTWGLPTPPAWNTPTRSATSDPPDCSGTPTSDPPDRSDRPDCSDRPDGSLAGDIPFLADGQPVSITDARRLACDAQIVPVVLGGDGEVLDIGRQSRVVPVGLRRALNLRDGGCRFPGCDRPVSWCDAHHIWFWADGGPTSLDNCVLLCAYHHTLVHEGWQLRGDPNGTIRFDRPDGTRLDLSSQPRSCPPTRGHEPVRRVSRSSVNGSRPPPSRST